MALTVPLALAASVLASLPASASAEQADGDHDQKVEFGSWQGSNFQDVYASIVSSNTLDEAAQFFEASASVQPEELPGLDSLTAAEKRQVLRAAAESAATGSDLPVEDLPLDTDSNVPRLVSSSETRRSPGIQRSASAPQSIGDAPLLGEPAAGGWAWKANLRFEWTECGWQIPFCEVTSWETLAVQTDPGDTATRNTWTLLKFGNEMNGLNYQESIYRNGSLAEPLIYWDLLDPGTGTYWNAHPSMANGTFQAYYELEIPTPERWEYFEFKSARTSPCVPETGGSAFRCVFPSAPSSSQE